jgi:hypothetical protein
MCAIGRAVLMAGKDEWSLGSDTNIAEDRLERFIEPFKAIQEHGAFVFEALEKPELFDGGIVRHRPQPNVGLDLVDLSPIGGNGVPYVELVLLQDEAHADLRRYIRMNV